MKQIIIFLLVVIIGIMGYNMYKKYQRFNPPNYEYTPSEAINSNHENKNVLFDYYGAVEELNGYVITQWSSNGIDVRSPKKDNVKTNAAVMEYGKKLGKVKYYEAQLLAKPVKAEANNNDNGFKKSKLIRKTFYANPEANKLRLGERSPLVYEIQALLNQKGDSIEHDGLFSTETFTALTNFEAKNGLFPDGKLDAITLEYLLK